MFWAFPINLRVQINLEIKFHAIVQIYDKYIKDVGHSSAPWSNMVNVCFVPLDYLGKPRIYQFPHKIYQSIN